MARLYPLLFSPILGMYPGERLRLAIRVILLALCWWYLQDKKGKSFFYPMTAISSLFLASLLFPINFFVYVLVSLTFIFKKNWKPAVGIALLLILSYMHLPSRQPTHPNPSPTAEYYHYWSTYWLKRENLFYVQDIAQKWSAIEKKNPGEGHFLYARVSWKLGHTQKAKTLIQEIIQHSNSKNLQTLAQKQLQDWANYP